MSNLVGIYEIAHMAGVTAAAVWNWRVRHQDTFPKPLAELKSGPVFDRADIERWLWLTGRLPQSGIKWGK